MNINEFLLSDSASELSRLRLQKPLVHCLSNEVTQTIIANVLLALGASPAMIVAKEECAEFAAQANALLINIGTLYPERAESMLLAIESANQAQTPWVLDPVAVGALTYRSEFAMRILNLRPTAIRGNAAEIMFLAGQSSLARGTDSLEDSTQAIEAACALARRYKTIVAISGKIDYITDGSNIYSVSRGNEIMQRVVGTGCALSAVVAALCADAANHLHAVAAACTLMSLAGEQASALCVGSGSFLPAFIDALYLLDAEQLMAINNA